ncbi:MAG: 23S rRNA (pseudouridine(1915)-N(3))-methyltransferase RlmH [Desulfovibrionaceae bacterium]|nr:23S rRNA (pseudouridine(1915)-N(3))-methyltransferase RlmH [Desulfovibrionaceae bacterium]
MYKASIISIGQLKASFWKEAAEFYRGRLSRSWRIREICLRDADSALPPAMIKEREGERIMAALPAGHTFICLDERGEGLSSETLARRLEAFRDVSSPPCFIIGGAWGLSEVVLSSAALRLSLGPMTLPHELAQVILWEQLFRVDSILRRSGYHH